MSYSLHNSYQYKATTVLVKTNPTVSSQPMYTREFPAVDKGILGMHILLLHLVRKNCEPKKSFSEVIYNMCCEVQ